MSEFRSCSRSEFFRRAKTQFSFLNDELIAKAIQRGHIHVVRRNGGYCQFDAQSWADLLSYIELRSRKASRLNDIQGAAVMGSIQ